MPGARRLESCGRRVQMQRSGGGSSNSSNSSNSNSSNNWQQQQQQLLQLQLLSLLLLLITTAAAAAAAAAVTTATNATTTTHYYYYILLLLLLQLLLLVLLPYTTAAATTSATHDRNCNPHCAFPRFQVSVRFSPTKGWNPFHEDLQPVEFMFPFLVGVYDVTMSAVCLRGLVSMGKALYCQEPPSCLCPPRSICPVVCRAVGMQAYGVAMLFQRRREASGLLLWQETYVVSFKKEGVNWAERLFEISVSQFALKCHVCVCVCLASFETPTCCARGSSSSRVKTSKTRAVFPSWL